MDFHPSCRYCSQHFQDSAYMYLHVGTKNAAKKLAKVCYGTLKQEGKTWFRQLSDKSVFKCSLHVVDNH